MERTPKNCSPTVMSFPITVTFRSATEPAVPGGGGAGHTPGPRCARRPGGVVHTKETMAPTAQWAVNTAD